MYSGIDKFNALRIFFDWPPGGFTIPIAARLGDDWVGEDNVNVDKGICFIFIKVLH